MITAEMLKDISRTKLRLYYILSTNRRIEWHLNKVIKAQSPLHEDLKEIPVAEKASKWDNAFDKELLKQLYARNTEKVKSY